jgi:hypothetical protein
VQVALSAFNRVLESGKHVVILAHQSVVRFDPPDGATPYDRYELQCAKDRKGGKGTASIVKEWCDALIFATYKTIVVEADSKKGKTTQAVGGREHICYATHSAAWDAKNRHGLPDKAMPFAWETIARLIAPVAHSVPNIVPEKQPEPEPELHAPPPKPPTIPARTHAEIPLAARLAIEPRAEEVNEFLKETNRIGELETWEDAPRDWLHRVARDPGAFIEFLKHRKK